MIPWKICVVLAIFGLCSKISSQDPEYLALLPLSGQGLTDREYSLIESTFRSEIKKSNTFSVYGSDSMMTVFTQNGITDGRDCHEFACALRMGELLSIDFIAQWRIGKILQQFTINVRIIDVTKKELVRDIADYYTGSFSQFLTQIIPTIADDIVSTKLRDRELFISENTDEKSSKDLGSTIQKQKEKKQNPPISPETVPFVKQLEQPVNDYISIGWEDESQDMPLENVLSYSLNDSTLLASKHSLKGVLRSKSVKNLKEEEVKKMMQRYGFYCVDSLLNSPQNDSKSTQTIDRNFTVQKDSILIDSTTGLMWQRGGSQNKLFYNDISTYITNNNLATYGGFSDWRLPTLEEVCSILRPRQTHGLYIAKVFGKLQQVVWTSDRDLSNKPWIVMFDTGSCTNDVDSHSHYVRMVRSF